MNRKLRSILYGGDRDGLLFSQNAQGTLKVSFNLNPRYAPSLKILDTHGGSGRAPARPRGAVTRASRPTDVCDNRANAAQKGFNRHLELDSAAAP